jgi:hypothetical protein
VPEGQARVRRHSAADRKRNFVQRGGNLERLRSTLIAHNEKENAMERRAVGLAGAAAVLMALTVTTPALAWNDWLDQKEDKLDRAENRYDERHDNSRRDVLEDRADRVEDRLDKAGYDNKSALDRHERRRWRAIATQP